MINKIIKEINNLNLGIIADFGYSDTSDSGIYVTNTYSERTSKHTLGDKVQILICLSTTEGGYEKIRAIAEKIINTLEKMNCVGINHQYLGEYQNRHNYSINLRTGGI